MQIPHRPKRRGPSARPHEKVDLDIVRRLESILHPSTDPAETREQHQEDERTKWFGVARDDDGETVFEDYGRYASLVSETARLASTENRYPQLVSFVGVTNAGKSTIVKMLVKRNATSKDGGFDAAFPSPVIGSVLDDTRTTSGNVNLYIDPAHHSDPLPIFFADCEGFEGGERAPLGSQYQQSTQRSKDEQPSAWVNTRPIKWADSDEHRRREYAVTVLYPRILYSFSDCVVFVLRNPKTFGSAALTKLLDWGAAALEKSMNQPALPHCIVALNDSHPGLDGSQWDIAHATQSLLSSVGDVFSGVEGVPQFRNLADHWQRLGREVNSIKDLILCYYASFKVVRIPAGPHYTLISRQIDKLHATIRADCEAAHESKRKARLLTNAEELNLYLQSGFDHFAANIDVPFDFMQASLSRNPIPKDFGEHILQLCETLSSRIPSREPARIKHMFQQLSIMLASCMLLDCARFRKGLPRQLFASYTHFFEYAMNEYLELHCPCSFVSLDGTRVCKSVKARHRAKGHQDDRGIIAAGDYVSPLDQAFARDWLCQLEAAVGDLQRAFSQDLNLNRSILVSQQSERSEEDIAFAIHIDRLDRFYRAIGPATWVRSHSTCYCCLMNVPQHALPCGHALCDRCARACGDLKQSTLLMTWCPLHRNTARWAQPKVVKYKPREASVRVLALDGGGIRGVVQLEILRAIEAVLGKHLPVQVFFDLMVGTGTGGLIAVALAEQGRTLDQCQDMLVSVCKQAYTQGTTGRALVKRAARAFKSSSSYGSSALREALEKTFPEDGDFFGEPSRFRPDAKVAVIAVSAIEHKTALISNYRRESDQHGFAGDSDDDCDLACTYESERPHDPANELKTRQAVYATMADPRFFAPLSFGGRYGGASKSVNAALMAQIESQKIWPDVEEPDLLLSLGTGQNRTAILAELLASPASEKSAESKRWLSGGFEKVQKITDWWLRKDGDILDAERAWQDFISSGPTETSSLSRRKRIRFNIDLGDPPARHHVSQMQRVSTLVREKLQEEHRVAALTNVAHRLAATSFYYQVGATGIDVHGGRFTIGRIACRFDSHSDYTKRLGRLLEDRCQPEFRPFFSVKSGFDEPPSIISMTPARLSRMIQHGVFDVPEIRLLVAGKSHTAPIRLHLMSHDRLEPEGYPISGGLGSTGDGANCSKDKPIAPDTPRSKKRSSDPQKKGRSGLPDQSQRAQETLPPTTAVMLKSANVPFWPIPSDEPKTPNVKRLAGGELSQVDESPPPYELENTARKQVS